MLSNTDLNIQIFTNDEDVKIAKELSDAILPLLRGKTINQIEIGLKMCSETIRLSVTI